MRYRTEGPCILTCMTVNDKLPQELADYVAEAVTDHMRIPRGPNTRDDAEDRPLDDPMKDRVNVEEGMLREDAGDIFYVRNELLDLEEDLHVALGVIDDFVAEMGRVAPKRVHAALDRAHRVASKLHDDAGLKRSQPPALPR